MRLLLALFLVCTGGVAHATWQTVRPLDGQWLAYDADYSAYVPFVEDRHADDATLSLRLTPRVYTGYTLVLEAEADLCLFLGVRLLQCQRQAGTVAIDLDSLRAATADSVFFLNFYHPNGAYDHLQEVRLARFVPTQRVAAEASVDERLPRRRTAGTQREATTLGLLILAFGYVFTKLTASRGFDSLVSLRGFFDADLYDYAGAQRNAWTTTHLLLVGLNCLALGLTFYQLRPVTGDLGAARLWSGWLRATWPLQALFLSSLVASYYVFELFAIYLGAWLFRLRGLANAHAYELIRYSTLTTICLALLTFAGLNAAGLPDPSVIVVATVIGLFAALRVVRLALMLQQVGAYRLLYLFSYLCASELIPIFVITKFIGVI